MRRSLLLLAVVAVPACGSTPRGPAPFEPRTSGTIAISGLAAPVRVVFDRWGIPHVYAENRDDLFVAQGFVQAQDRLFQIDLWRRASQGRLSEILGANFVERDAMTRRIQYRGDPTAEWASYGPETHAIAEAFVRGVNACVSLARERLPEDFRVAGWPPSYWSADDLLNRTDAFVTSEGAFDAIRRAALPDVVADAIRLVGTAPFLVGPGPPDAATRAQGGRRLLVPSPRYLIHLVAPGWNVIGGTAPWRPGVVEGHTDRIAWARSPIGVPTEDIVVERLDRTPITATSDFMRVKGRPYGVTFVRQATPIGVVIATDRERNRAYAVRWVGFQPGGAAELGALALNQARSAAEFRGALTRWKLPASRFTFRDVDGGSGSADVPAPVAEGAADAGLANRGPGARTATVPIDRSAIFAHVLGVGTHQRFNVGPVPRPADDRQLQLVPDPNAWDRWRAINAPGQSGSMGSRHYADAAAVWSTGSTAELWFTDNAVSAHAEGTLMLIPRP